MHDPRYFQQLVEERLTALPMGNRPPELYEPIRYMLALGGKRMRPAMLLMANELFDGKVDQAIGAALGVEVFHNFTLLHDDIMDKAPLRRSHPTVHARWNTDIAILSGDTMFVKACQLMMEVPEVRLPSVLADFFQTAIEVCEGQQFDMNFETQPHVTIPDYLDMIRLKTAVLLGSSLRIGATIAGADPQDAQRMYRFGESLGIAFQLHDDLLDAYGDPEKFGKQVGGDILANKKTFLLLTAMDRADMHTLEELRHWLTRKEFNPFEKVNAVKAIFEKLEIREATESEIQRHFQAALEAFDQLTVPEEKKTPLRQLAERLMVRES